MFKLISILPFFISHFEIRKFLKGNISLKIVTLTAYLELLFLYSVLAIFNCDHFDFLKFLMFLKVSIYIKFLCYYILITVE